MEMCCDKCFKNQDIINYILSNGVIGDCPVCGNRGVKTISLKELGQFIRECLDKAYEELDEGTGAIYDSEDECYIDADGEDAHGESVHNILIEDEDIFSSDINAEELLEVIFNLSAPNFREIQKGEIDKYPDIHDCRYVLRDSLFGVEASEEFYDWQEFRHRTMYYNRYFDVDNDNNSRNNLLDSISIIFPAMEESLEADAILYRVRGLDELPDSFTDIDYYKEISPAPPKFAVSNRMSPQGISYTYLATSPETCYKECRMKPGEYALVGKFIIKKNLRILNLSSKKFLYVRNSIFDKNYKHGLNWINEFIRVFSMDISSVINPLDKEIEYVPTQVIAEYIRSKGYDGIKFESSVNKGSYNYTLFCGPNKEISSEYYPTWFLTYWYNKDLVFFTKWLKLINIKLVELISDTYGEKVLESTNDIRRSDIVTEVEGTSDFNSIDEIEERVHILDQHLNDGYKALIADGSKFSVEQYIRELLKKGDGEDHCLNVSKTFGYITVLIDGKEFSFEDKRGGDWWYEEMRIHH